MRLPRLLPKPQLLQLLLRRQLLPRLLLLHRRRLQPPLRYPLLLPPLLPLPHYHGRLLLL